MNVIGGTTDVTTYFVLRTAADGTATTGATITDIDLQYVRTGVAPVAKVDATELAATDSAHADNKAKEIDGTDAPGLYRVDWPDAAFAAGVRQVVLTVKLASSFTEHLVVEIDPPVGVAASVSGAVGSVTGAVGSVTGAVGSVTGNVGGNVTGTVASVVGAVGSVAGSVGSVAGNVAGNVIGNLNGNVLGGISGSVAAVTGNVGGNVLGNVNGSVASVAGAVASVGAGGITAATFAANAVDAAALATDAVNEIRDAVFAKTGLTIGGVTNFGDITKIMYALLRGKVTRAGNVYPFKDDDNTTTVVTLTIVDPNRTVA